MITQSELTQALYTRLDGVELRGGQFDHIIHFRTDGQGREVIVPIVKPEDFAAAYMLGCAVAKEERLSHVVVYCDVQVSEPPDIRAQLRGLMKP